MAQADRSPLLSTLLVPLSLFLLAAGLLVGAGLALLEMLQGGGWFAGLGYALALLALGAGNLASFLLNALCWGLKHRPSWLRRLLLAQAAPALLCAAWASLQLRQEWQERRAGERYGAIRDAVAHDDAAALEQLRASCGERCRPGGSASPDALLLMAAQADAHQVARRLLAEGARAPAGLGAPAIELHTCEGLYLPAVHALDMAVARNDDAMLRLLLPAADEDSRYQALRTAAVLDRLPAFEALLAGGITLPRAAPYDGPYDHLLSVAAGGASMQVAARLLDTPPAPVTREVLQAALESLWRFMVDAGAGGYTRAIAFARLLAAHGADLDAPYRDQSSLLAEAVRSGRGDVAQALIQAGANLQRLTPPQRLALDALLRSPQASPADERRAGCVAP